MRWIGSAQTLVRSNSRLFPLANSANVLDDLAADGIRNAERVALRIGSVPLEGGQATPTTVEIQALIARAREYAGTDVESFARNVEAVRVWVLIRLTHFATAYAAAQRKEEAEPVDAAD
jgi:hypothetical protein